jgi:dTDP-4-dehydrorhamnose reductase
MRVLILGGNGMLGHKLVQQLKADFQVSATFRRSPAEEPYADLYGGIQTIDKVEAYDFTSVESAIDASNPEVVINAIGVIKQLAGSKDVIQSLTVNSLLPQRLGELAQERNFRLIHVSTDCVFDGVSGGYRETDIPNALDLYGQSKHWGEVSGANCITLRTSIIGRELGSSHSLIDWFLSNRGKQVNGYTNAIYSGFPTIVFADIIRDLITNFVELTGLFQVSSEPINKFDLLQLVNSAFDAGVDIERYDEFKIDRSLDSTSFRTATGFVPMPWPEMIERMAADPTPYDKWKQKDL